MAPLAEAFTGELTDYTDAPRLPYRPSRRDFQRPGRLWARALWEIPLTTGTAQWAFEALRDRAASDDEASCHERVARGGAFEGWHDRADEQAIAGWAFDASAPERVVAVDIYDGERRIARVDAGSFRADLLAAHKGDGRHAFELPLPEFLRDGNAHSIAVRVAGTDLSLGGTPHEVSSLPSGSPGPAFLTFFLAYNPAILRGMIESVLDRQGSPYLAMILRTSVMLPDERARVERNLDYLLSRHDVERMLIATPDEAIAALGRNGPSPRN
jgi:hypothetical protein